MFMLDKFGNVLRATDEDSVQIVAYIGPGRPLGFHIDAEGNIIVCDSLKVRDMSPAL